MFIQQRAGARNEVARQKVWPRKPTSVYANALHHDGLETFPGCPPIPCIKLRGLWMHDLGIRPGTRLHVEVTPEMIVLRMERPVVSAPSRVAVASLTSQV